MQKTRLRLFLDRLESIWWSYRRSVSAALDNEKSIGAKPKLIGCLLIFLVSFSMRTLSAADMASSMYGPDQPCAGMLEYDYRAVLIAEGHGVLFPDSPKHSDTALISYPPGYSIFLAVIYHLVGRDYFAVQLAQNLLNSLSCVLIFLIAAQLVGWRVGVISGLLAAVSHHLSYYSNFILPDAL